MTTITIMTTMKACFNSSCNSNHVYQNRKNKEIEKKSSVCELIKSINKCKEYAEQRLFYANSQ